MIGATGPTPLTAAARVAAYTALIALVLYAAATLAILAISTELGVSAVDQQLADRYGMLHNRPLMRGLPPDREFSHEGSFGPLYQWVITPGGDVALATANGPDLPPAYRHVAEPTTVDLGGEQVRLLGGPCVGGYLVVGESLSFVAQGQRGLVGAAATALLPFLGLVFLAALTIGRRSAQPIDKARRQLLAFTADASHELRTPLQVIEAETSLALRRNRDAGSYRGTIERIAGESARLRHLVDDLLWLARFDNQSIAAGGGPIDLAAAAATAVQRFQSVAQQRDQKLTLVLAEGQTPMARVPEELAGRLLGVLLDNACRYTPAGGSIEVWVGASGTRVQLRVDDSGPGVPLAERETIFRRFHRVASEGGGSGLGLAIGDAIVTATKGRWEVGESAAGGASFTVWWALVRQPKEEQQKEAVNERGPRAARASREGGRGQK